MVNIQSKSAHKLETTMIKTIFLLTCCVLFFSFCSAPSQAQKLVNGRCGVANGVATKLPSSTKLCYTGHASAVTGTGSWNWTCAGRNGGSTESCSAPLALLVNGECGPASGAQVSSAPSTNLCTTGTASAVSSSGPWTWSCAGSYGGTTASCSAPLASVAVNGQCGPANGAQASSTPTGNLCTAGTASAVSDSGPWTWSCAGSNGGTTASCSVSLSSSGNVEVPGPSQTLFNHPFYTCLRNFYVATNGNDSNDGTSPGTAWATIQHADTTSRTGGDCINVAPGTYQQYVRIQHGGISPTSTGYVVYRCQALDACHILAPGGGHLWGFAKAGNFVVVDGFELDGNNSLQTDGVADTCIGTDDATYGAGNSSYQAGASSHHLWVLNNIIHHCNLSGVTLNNKEWFYTIHNTVYHNAWTSGYQGSGIGYVVLQCIEANGTNCYTSGIAGTPPSDYNYTPSGNDLVFNPPSGYYPFHNVVAWNIVYNNRINYNNPVGCSAHTDGNGIIMDTFLDMFSNTLTYPFQTLVMTNVSYYNGGRGIHVFRSSNVTVANNTVFNNNTDTCLSAATYVLGDLSEQGGANNVWLNNASKTVTNVRNNSCALVAGNGAGVTDLNHSYNNNVLSTAQPTNSNPPCVFDNDVKYFSCLSNKCSTDPGFVNATPGVAGGNNGVPTGGTWRPGNSNFAITATSPAYGYAKPEAYLPSQNTDAGACSRALTTCPNPGTSNY